jgi:Flp pilus assembly pilin Flp
MRDPLRRFAGDRSGATAIEYAAIAAGVCVAVLLGATLMGNALTDVLTATAALFSP